MVNPLMNHLAFNAIINLAIWPLKPKMYYEDIGTNVFIQLPDMQVATRGPEGPEALT